MADRPVIPMSGQPAGQAAPPQPYGGSASAGVGHSAPGPWKSSHIPIMKYWKNFRRQVKKNPAVWWPIISVVTLLVAGLAAGGVDTSNSSRKDSALPSTSVVVVPKDAETINELIIQSIVSIIVYEDGRPCSGGSGSVVGDGLHVLTNHHVVVSDEECRIDEIRVQTVKNSGDLPEDSFIGEVLASDEDIDLALLTIRPIGSDAPDLRPLELSTTNAVGQDIVVVGFPAIGGDSVTVSKGIISGFAFKYGVQWIKTDAAISGGNSGGAALDSKNRLIGIPTMFSQSSDGRGADCRKVADTNGDGEVDDKDTCVGVGGSFSLMATSDTAIKFAKSHGLDISESAPSIPPTTFPN
jgi:S1-C subfamily serine protease